MSSRELRRPQNALSAAIARTDKKLSSIEAKSYGAGAVREVFEAGTVSCAANVVTTVASTTCDPGRWSVIFAALGTLTIPVFQDQSGIVYPENKVVTATLTLSGFNITRTMFQTTSGTLTQQIVGTGITSFTSQTPTTLNMTFQWSSNFGASGSYGVFNRQITLIPL